jgi:hypothetical protein
MLVSMVSSLRSLDSILPVVGSWSRISAAETAAANRVVLSATDALSGWILERTVGVPRAGWSR